MNVSSSTILYINPDLTASLMLAVPMTFETRSLLGINCVTASMKLYNMGTENHAEPISIDSPIETPSGLDSEIRNRRQP